MNEVKFKIGLDVGSTTIKCVVLKDKERLNTKKNSLQKILELLDVNKNM